MKQIRLQNLKHMMVNSKGDQSHFIPDGEIKLENYPET